MLDWKKIKFAALEYGLFFGILSWLFATAITNEMTSANVWGIILSRILTGVLVAALNWEITWWIRGAIFGAAVNTLFWLLSLLPLGPFFAGWRIGFSLIMISGIIFGILLELAVKHREKQLAALQSAE